MEHSRRGSNAVYGDHERRGSLVDELTRQSRVFFDDEDFDKEDGNEDATTDESGSGVDSEDDDITAAGRQGEDVDDMGEDVRGQHANNRGLGLQDSSTAVE